MFSIRGIKIKSKKGKIILLASIILVFVIVAFISSRVQPTMVDNFGIVQVSKGDVVKSIEGYGNIEAVEKYEITSLVNGDVLQDYFEEGQMVNKGDLLYLLDSTDLDFNIKKAEAELEKAKNTYSNSQYDVDDLTIKSTTNGIITKIHVKNGDMVSSGTDIVDIADYDNLVLTLNFLAENAKEISVGESASINVDGTNTVLNGTVKSVSNGKMLNEYGIPVSVIEISVRNPGRVKSGDKATAIIGEYSCNSAGTFAYASETTIKSMSDGKVKTINCKVGNQVSNGTVLGQLENRNLVITNQQNQTAITDAELSLENYREQLNDYKIVAPISGKVIKKNVKAGEKLDTSRETVMAVIENQSSLVFNINVNELNITKVFVGQEVNITIDALEGEKFTGYVDKINTSATINNGITTYPVRIVIENPDTERMLTGMNARATIVIAEKKSVLRIPTYCVERGNYVNVAKNKDDVIGKKKQIEIGLNDGEYVEVISGLSENDYIIFTQTDYESEDEVYD